MSDREFQLVYFRPNPLIEWEVPVAFILHEGDQLRCAELTSTMPIGLPLTAWTLVECCVGLILKTTNEADLQRAWEGMGPHFTRGERIPVPSKLTDAEAWILKLFKQA